MNVVFELCTVYERQSYIDGLKVGARLMMVWQKIEIQIFGQYNGSGRGLIKIPSAWYGHDMVSASRGDFLWLTCLYIFLVPAVRLIGNGLPN